MPTSSPQRAVFLSCASQDRQAARRICDALSEAGVEVWLDHGEERGGEAWDRKVRRQIRDCALFLALISANTEARVEGYFRLEWKLAVDRSDQMAHDARFILPIIIDGARAPARIPDRFRDLEWTWLQIEQSPAEFSARIAAILSGSAHPAPGRKTRASAVRRYWIGGAIGLLLLAAGAYFGIYVRKRAPGVGQKSRQTESPGSEVRQVATAAAPQGAPADAATPPSSRNAEEQSEHAAILARIASLSDSAPKAHLDAVRSAVSAYLASAPVRLKSDVTIAWATRQSEWHAAQLALRGGVYITTDPPGAEVQVGGAVLDKSPLRQGALPPGSFPVLIRLAGYEDWTGEIGVAPNDFAKLSVKLVRSVGALNVESNPSGLRVDVKQPAGYGDASASGRTRHVTTPASLGAVPTGQYQLIFHRRGWPNQTRSVTVGRNQTAAAIAEFSYGKLALTSTPSGAEVWAGEKRLGTTPLKLDNTIPGSVELEFRLPSFDVAHANGEVMPGQTTSVDVTLVRRSRPVAEHTWENSLGMRFVPVPGVQVLFSIWDTRVRDFRAFVDDTGLKWRKPNFQQDPTHPAVMVSWDDAQAFCEWLTEKERKQGQLAPDQSYRLPTDAEWSIAVGLSESSAGTPESKSQRGNSRIFPWGTQWPPPNGAGNYPDETAKRIHPTRTIIPGYRDGFADTSPVGSFAANRFGLFDMGGNVLQWCEDLFDQHSGMRVIRGGSFFNYSPLNLCSSHRVAQPAQGLQPTVGFRCVLATSSAAAASAAGIPRPMSSWPKAGRPWQNSLGMKFAPVPGARVLFSIWDTRVQDFEAFVHATSYNAVGGMMSFDAAKAATQAGATWRKPGFSQTAACPVVGISWYDAKAFCRWLTEKERAAGRIGPTQSYRLPADAEWSAAVGLGQEAGETPREKSSKVPGLYPWGTTWPPPPDSGNFADESARRKYPQWTIIAGYDDRYADTSPVGSFKPNRLGLYDMSGNVWQWCEDYYNGHSGNRVLRGGSFNLEEADALLSSNRRSFNGHVRYVAFGFRCVAEVSPF